MSQPPTDPGRPRRAAGLRIGRAARLATLAIALTMVFVLLGVGAMQLWATGQRVTSVAQRFLVGEGDDTAKPPDRVSADARRRDAVRSLFDARSRAVLARDEAAFLSLVDPGAQDFFERQQALYDELVKVPLAGWAYDVVGDGPALAPDRKRRLSPGSWIVRVTLHYTFEGSTSSVDREQYFTLVPDGKKWLLAEDRDGIHAGMRSQRDVWDLGPITVVRGNKSIVVGQADRDELSGYAGAADRAVRDVNRVWKGAWTRRPVVIVPRSQAVMATIIDAETKGLDQIAAVTTGHSHAGPTRGDRIVVNPKAWRELTTDGRHVVMTHEVTHLATRASTYRALPMWLSEGFADYVAYSSVNVSDRVVAQDLLAQVRAGDLPKALPRNEDFDATRTELGPAYEGAWLVCRMIAETYGQDNLVELYLVSGDSTPGTLAGDLQQVLGVSETRLVKDWQHYLKGLAWQ